MCGNPISAIQAEADRAAAKLRAERDRAAQKAKAERDRVTSKVETAAAAAGTSIQDIIKGAISETKKSIPKSDHQPIVVSRERLNTVIGGMRNPFSGGRDYSRDLRRLRDRATTPPVVKAPEVNLPSVNIPKPAPLPSPNMNQDLTKADLGTVQAAAIKAGTDVQNLATKTGTDIQTAATTAGSNVQAGVSAVTSATGMKNETLEKIISSNVKGTEASISNNVKGLESSISSNVKGTEASISNNVKGLENTIADIAANFEKPTTSTEEPAPTGLPFVPTPKPSPIPGPEPLPGPDAFSGTSGDTTAAAERKARNQLLASSRYGRRGTILTSGSGVAGYGY